MSKFNDLFLPIILLNLGDSVDQINFNANAKEARPRSLRNRCFRTDLLELHRKLRLHSSAADDSLWSSHSLRLQNRIQ